MKHLISSLLLLCGLATFAQTGFIEVEVTDTVWMKPVAFEYNIAVKDDPYAIPAFGSDNEENSEETEKADAKQKTETLKSFLIKKGFTPKALEGGDFNIFGMGRQVDGFTVMVKTNKELERLKEEVKTLDYADGKMGTVDYGDKSAYDARIFKKLIDGARKKAQTISSLSGQKLGKILEVKEPTSVNGGMESYMKEFTKIFEAMQGKLKKGSDDKLYGELTKTITVKFVAE